MMVLARARCPAVSTRLHFARNRAHVLRLNSIAALLLHACQNVNLLMRAGATHERKLIHEAHMHTLAHVANPTSPKSRLYVAAACSL